MPGRLDDNFVSTIFAVIVVRCWFRVVHLSAWCNGAWLWHARLQSSTLHNKPTRIVRLTHTTHVLFAHALDCMVHVTTAGSATRAIRRAVRVLHGKPKIQPEHTTEIQRRKKESQP